MKNVTTFETSRALRAAHFPQPEYAFGQFWYSESGGLCVCLSSDGDFVQDDGSVWHPGEIEKAVFAPTAVDILREFTIWDAKKIMGRDGFEGLMSIVCNVEDCATAFIEKRMQEIWAELDAKTPESGTQREKLNKAKRAVDLAKQTADFVKSGDFEGLLQLLNQAEKKEFPKGGF